MNDPNQISQSPSPSEKDQLILDEAIAAYQNADKVAAESVFEEHLTNLAKEIYDRCSLYKSNEWLKELSKLVLATSDVDAENIAALADALLLEKDGMAALRSSRYYKFGVSYTPEESIYLPVNNEGARLVAVAREFDVSLRGFPIFRGSLKILDEERLVTAEINFATGGGSQSHRVTNGPLPPGRYRAHQFRRRNDLGFVVDGVGYSINLDEVGDTQVFGRKYFRIHPDGASYGTKGCIGVEGNRAEQTMAMTALHNLLDEGEVILAMNYER